VHIEQLREHLEKSDYWIAGGAGAYGLCVSHLATLLLTMPWWVKGTLQALFTLGLSLGAITAQFFWRRYLHRRFLGKEQSKGETEGQ